MYHNGPYLLRDDEDDLVIGQCICGWETEPYETESEAQDAFDCHFYADFELEKV